MLPLCSASLPQEKESQYEIKVFQSWNRTHWRRTNNKCNLIFFRFFQLPPYFVLIFSDCIGARCVEKVLRCSCTRSSRRVSFHQLYSVTVFADQPTSRWDIGTGLFDVMRTIRQVMLHKLFVFLISIKPDTTATYITNRTSTVTYIIYNNNKDTYTTNSKK